MKCLRLLHIPKTAGSTLTHVLLRQYRRRRYFSFQGEIIPDTQRYYKLSEQQRSEIELFLGHAPISTGIPDADKATLITLVRDPIDRVKSFCQHVSEGKAPYLLKDFPPELFDLDEFLNSGNLELSNMQTKMLINAKSCASSDLLDKMTPSDAKEKALENLFHKVGCFGIQKHFDESLILFSQFLNWKMPFYVSANKKNPKQLINFKPHHLEHIAELNSIDIEIYNIAKKRFLEIIERADYDSAKLKRLKFLNPSASGFLRIRYQMNEIRRNQK
jgi:hypothetical protein